MYSISQRTLSGLFYDPTDFSNTLLDGNRKGQTIQYLIELELVQAKTIKEQQQGKQKEKVVPPLISLSGADLSRANLSDAFLSGAFLSGADLSGAGAGGDLKTIQQRSGHASIANVGIYIQGLDGAADTAGELL